MFSTVSSGGTLHNVMHGVIDQGQCMGLMYVYMPCVICTVLYIMQIPHGVSDDEAVRIFIEFSKVDTAIKGTYPI